MAHETAARNTPRREANYGSMFMGASKTIYAHTMICARIDSSGHTALAERAADAADLKFVGVAQESKTSGASAGVDRISYWKKGEFQFDASGLNADDVEKIAYVAYDGTISITGGTNKIKVGTITEVVSATLCWVAINEFGLSNLGGAALLDVGTEAGTVAEGNHTHS